MATRTDELIDIRDGQDGGRQEGGTDRGRDADAPGDVPTKGWKDVALRVKGEVKDDQVPLLSAGVAFYLLLALFPALAALVSLYGLFADPAQVSQQVGDLTGTLPQEAQSLITDQLEKEPRMRRTTKIIAAGISTIALAGGIGVGIASADPSTSPTPSARRCSRSWAAPTESPCTCGRIAATSRIATSIC